MVALGKGSGDSLGPGNSFRLWFEMLFVGDSFWSVSGAVSGAVRIL